MNVIQLTKFEQIRATLQFGVEIANGGDFRICFTVGPTVEAELKYWMRKYVATQTVCCTWAYNNQTQRLTVAIEHTQDGSLYNGAMFVV